MLQGWERRSFEDLSTLMFSSTKKTKKKFLNFSYKYNSKKQVFMQLTISSPPPARHSSQTKLIHLTAILSLNDAFDLLKSRALMIYIWFCSLGVWVWGPAYTQQASHHLSIWLGLLKTLRFSYCSFGTFQGWHPASLEVHTGHKLSIFLLQPSEYLRLSLCHEAQLLIYGVLDSGTQRNSHITTMAVHFLIYRFSFQL